MFTLTNHHRCCAGEVGPAAGLRSWARPEHVVRGDVGSANGSIRLSLLGPAGRVMAAAWASSWVRSDPSGTGHDQQDLSTTSAWGDATRDELPQAQLCGASRRRCGRCWALAGPNFGSDGAPKLGPAEGRYSGADEPNFGASSCAPAGAEVGPSPGRCAPASARPRDAAGSRVGPGARPRTREGTSARPGPQAHARTGLSTAPAGVPVRRSGRKGAATGVAAPLPRPLPADQRRRPQVAGSATTAPGAGGPVFGPTAPVPAATSYLGGRS